MIALTGAIIALVMIHEYLANSGYLASAAYLSVFFLVLVLIGLGAIGAHILKAPFRK